MHPHRYCVPNRSQPRSLGRSRPPLCCEPLESRRLMAAGDLDPSFGGDGDVSSVVPTASIFGEDVAVQADGKTVVAGWIRPGSGFAVTRYNLNGTPDTTFGPDHNGTVLTRASQSVGTGVAIQQDGKIVVVGTVGTSDTRVVRYNTDGSLDRSFDGDGIVGFDPGGLFDAITLTNVLIQGDGKILLGGDGVTGLFNSNSDLVFARLNPDGSLDSGFGDGGVKVLGFGSNETFAGMALDYSGSPASNPDYGKIVAAGTAFNDDYSTSEFLVTRLTTGGSLDKTFDGDGSGMVRYPGDPTVSEARCMTIQDDGRIVVGGLVAGAYLAARFLQTGPLDTSFGNAGTGWVKPPIGGLVSDVMVAPSGGLILAGTQTIHNRDGTTTDQDAIAYLTADGLPDTQFGASGKVVYPFGGDKKLAAGPGRRFVFAGGDNMHAARFLDVGANLVYAVTLNPTASEQGPTARGFFVYRVERVPYATRVYFDVGGTATAPTLRARSADYTSDGMAFPIPILGGSSTPYVDIPANQTFASVIITPVDDALVEGNETATFNIRPDPNYEVGDPSKVTLVITDNDSPPPTVAQVYVRGSAWKGTDGDDLNTTFKEYLTANSLGDAEYGYRADNLAAGTTLPWTNLDQVVLRYSSPPTGSGIPTAAAATLHGLRSDYSVTAVDAVDPQTFLLSLDRPLGALPAAAGGGSDGDVVSLSVAGAGPGGGAYTLALNTLQGDADRAGGRVTALDLGFVKARLNRTANDPAASGAQYTPFADANGDGRINAIDLGAVKARLNDALPPILTALEFGPVRDEPISAQVLGR